MHIQGNKNKMKKTTFKLGQNNNQNKHGRNKKILLVFLILVLAATAVADWMFTQREEVLKTDNSAQTVTKQINADKNSQGNEQKPANLPDNSTSITPDDVPNSPTLTVGTPSFTQANGIIGTSSKVGGTDSEGTCVITFKNPDDRPVIRELTSTKQVCSTSIPEVEFQKLGTWSLNVTFYSGNTKAEVNKDVTIN